MSSLTMMNSSIDKTDSCSLSGWERNSDLNTDFARTDTTGRRSSFPFTSQFVPLDECTIALSDFALTRKRNEKQRSVKDSEMDSLGKRLSHMHLDQNSNLANYEVKSHQENAITNTTDMWDLWKKSHAIMISPSANDHPKVLSQKNKHATPELKETLLEENNDVKFDPTAFQNHHRIIKARLIERGYPPAYAQVLAGVLLQAQARDSRINSVYQSPFRGGPFIWNGELPPRNYSNPVFSCKVFVGGVPWDITESSLIEAFGKYGMCRVEWPVKDLPNNRQLSRRPKVPGYVYMIFDNEWAVKKLLQDCSQDVGSAGEWYFKLGVNRGIMREVRQVQIIPWVVSDASYSTDNTTKPDSKKTVFVGALHGMITAHVLASIMKNVFGDVVFVGIDTDKYKYPIAAVNLDGGSPVFNSVSLSGSARLTFASLSSYFRAIESGFLEIRTSKFIKKVQIDPFLEDSQCSQCDSVQGPYFCREKDCFRYFCFQCWEVRHSMTGPYVNHRSVVRRSKRSAQSALYSDQGKSHYHVTYGPCNITSTIFEPQAYPHTNHTTTGKNNVNYSNLYQQALLKQMSLTSSHVLSPMYSGSHEKLG